MGINTQGSNKLNSLTQEFEPTITQPNLNLNKLSATLTHSNLNH